MRRYFFLMVLFLPVTTLKAQTNINHLFVNSTTNILRLDFSNGTPATSYLGFGSGAGIGEGIAHMENKEGKVIILVNSSGVYDANGIIMPGSQGILAHPSSTEIVICRKPLSESLYYIVYNNQLCSGLYYTVVDMTLRDGLGDVVQLNVPLDGAHQYAEGLEFVTVPCSNDLLLLAYRCYTGFVKFELTEAGFSGATLIYEMNSNNHGGRGELDFRKGKVGYAMTFTNQAFIADLDPSTGIMSGGRTLSFPSTNGIYGLEFTDDASRLYVTDLDNRDLFGNVASPNLFCYHMQTGQVTSWTLSNQSSCPGADPQGLGQIEIGKDENLYVPLIGACRLYVVEQPNSDPVIKAIETDFVLSAGISDHIKSDFLEEYAIPTSKISAGKETLVLCRGERISLTVDSVPGLMYQWYRDETLIPAATGIQFDAREAGRYSVHVKDSLGCGQFSTPLDIHQSSIGKPLLGNDTTVCLGATVTLTIDAEDASFLWNDGDTGPVKLVQASGTYQVKVSKDGCDETDSIRVEVISADPGLVPNVITPNGDSRNEYFTIPWKAPSPIGLRIFNRWGTEVYGTPDYKNLWTAEGLPGGVYYYQTNSPYRCLNVKGWIHVFR